ncbi:cytochrome P450 6k1-like [Copidosoma floridanum]|uniref:cytochrome P450 6k1-like n=1 Tax=Copidosoma floridanum TaxID=29053 RepID=UPI0006C94666|nr:cytochrome P450 6k1-like [Copidosoma floridanum]
MIVSIRELLIVFFSCICIVFVVFYLYVTRNYNYWKKLGVKHLRPSFPFGNFGKCMFLQQSIHEFINDIYQDGKGEKMVGFYVLNRPYVLLRDPELLRSVFIKDFDIFSNKLISNNKSDPFGTHMILLETNPPSRYIRQKLSPMFTTGRLKKNFGAMLEIYEDLDVYLDKLGLRAFRAISNAKFFDAETEFFENMFSRIVDERIMSGNKKNDFVDLVINMIGSEEIGNTDEIKVGHRSWMSQLAGIFSAGFETSSTTTTFSLYQIAVNPEVQKRLRDELTSAMEKSNGQLTYDMITNAPYLNMIVLEVLRMYPILTWVDRLPDIDYTFPGTNVTIKKGTPVIFPIHSMQMDPKYHLNPEKFDPERFSIENESKIISFTYSPFGKGPRNCIGSRLGLLQIKLALAYLVLNYEITPCKKTPIPLQHDKQNMFMHPRGDIYLNFTKISQG